MASPGNPTDSESTTIAEPVARDRWTASRVFLLVLVGGAALYAMSAGVFGITAIAVQTLHGQAVMTLHFADSDNVFFSSVGLDGSDIRGNLDSARVGLNGLTAFALTLKAIGDVLGVLAQVALALAAAGIGRALLKGRPFSGAVTRNAIIAAVSLLGLGVASQLIGWWARVVILNEMDSVAFSRDLTFDPAVVTAGLAVALVALAFRYGERMQSDTDGLV